MLLRLSALEQRASPRPGAPAFRSLRALYITSFVLGFGSAVLLYGVFFNRMSETQLVQVAALWFLPLVFGLTGVIAERAVTAIHERRAQTFREALALATHAYGGLVALLVFVTFGVPALVVPLRRLSSPLRIAALATLTWGVALAIFLGGIFPSL